MTDDNTYFVELDSRYNKHVKIATSKSNGEQFKYTIVIDTKNSVLKVCDDDNNEMMIDSTVPRVLLRNNNNTLLDLAKENMSLVCPKELLIKVGSRAVFDIPSLYFKNDSGQGCEWITKSLSIKGSGNCVIDFPAVGLNKLVRLQSVVTGPLQSSVVNLGTPGAPFKPVSIPTTDGYNPAINNPNISPSLAQQLADAADKVAENPYEQVASMVRSVTSMAVKSGVSSPLYGELTTPGNNTGIYHIWKAIHLLADAIDVLASFHPVDVKSPYTDPARDHADKAYKGHYVA